ncbi:hypothetical protein EKO04_005714 [Ascochyta lentis]|uniref:Uncharacterized protein n=1 Tax=Ascochyta lentis TaxID=205686 RepID=A0A8H7J6V0_9PLEO|nr:hypothetical protein EKO04_005714 [Ascochyta lentis]
MSALSQAATPEGRPEQRNAISNLSGSALNFEKWSRSFDQALPAHERARPGRWQRFCLDWLTSYRVLISGVIVTNLGVLTSRLIVKPPVDACLTATAANIIAAVLLRQEEVINASFRLVSKLPVTLPLTVRKIVGNFYHYGGVHVGCALSALLWYCMFIGLNTARVLRLVKTGNATNMLYVDIVTAYVALLAIVSICATAVPKCRVSFHNTFEVTHRFGGWVALLVLWIHVGITTLTPDNLTPLYAHPSLWLLAITTLLIILPWLRIRRVPIIASRISAREVLLIFPYTSMPHTTTMRTSITPLTEWHAFATIPIDSTSASIIISHAGDWTNNIIASPPKQIWIRNPPTLNFLAFAPLFHSVLLVATGAGIGPVLSLLASPAISHMLNEDRKVRVMWCVYDSSAPHWAFALAAIRKVDAAATVFDSKTGRPDVGFEAPWLAQKEKLEAVMVVSNPPVTKEVVDQCKIAGLAAYGAVFDS